MEIYQVDKICRCCLQSTGQMKPLYGSSLDEMLRSVADLEVRPNDGHPELVCSQCVLELSRAFRFKAQCQKSNKIMLEFLKNAVPDVEVDDTQSESFSEENNDVVLKTEDDPNLLVEEKPSVNNNALWGVVEEKCSICDKIFNTRKKLERHIKTHNKKPYKCSHCSKEFSRTAFLTTHLIVKHTDAEESNCIKQHSCSVCGKQFKYAGSLFRHNKIHTGNNILHCPYCPKYFLENAGFQIHLRTHTGDRPFVCPICNRTFASTTNLNRHKRSHSEGRPSLECNICKRTFADRHYLKHHIMNVHDKKQIFTCSECGKRLATAKNLNAHMRLHTNHHKVYKCGFGNCDKTFSRSSTAAIHRRIHTGEKPHFCDKCPIGFKTKNQLLIHSKTHQSQAEKPGPLSDDVVKNVQGEGGNRKMIESMLLFALNQNEER